WNRPLRTARRVERDLNVHSEIDDVRDELRVRLRLVPPTHDAEGDARVATFHERLDDCMNGPLATGEHIRVRGVEGEQPASVLKHEPGAAHGESRTETDRRKVALNERHHVAVAIDDREIRRAVVDA